MDDLYLRLAEDPKWVCQAKLDGRRALWDGSRLWSRQGNPLDLCEPLVSLLRTHSGGVELDGEYVTVTGTGRREACFWVFDIPTYHKMPLEGRWELLELTLAPMMGSGYVELCPSEVSWEDVAEHEWEGVVFKKRDSRYKRGISPGKTVGSWIKYRAAWL